MGTGRIRMGGSTVTECIIPGTTPTMAIRLDQDVSDWDDALLTIRHGGVTLVERSGEALTLSPDGRTVSAVLTQSETLRLPNSARLGLQLRVLMNGVAMATDVIALETASTLSRKELSSNE